MKYKQLPLVASVLLAFSALPALAITTSFQFISYQSSGNPLMGADLPQLVVFANGYVTTGANSKVIGNVLSGGVLTTGAASQVLGSIVSSGASNIGGGAASVLAGSNSGSSGPSYLYRGMSKSSVPTKLDGSISSGDVVTVGAASTIGGAITSSGAATIGANAKVGGDLVAGGIVTTGDTAAVSGSIEAGGYASLGANSVIEGNVAGVGHTTMGANSAAGSQSALSSSPITPSDFTASLNSTVVTTAQKVVDAQASFTALGLGQAMSTTMSTNTTLYGGGVFSAANFSTTAGTTLTLDDQGGRHDWVFNISDFLVTGASSTVIVANANPASTVTWNVKSGYASLGANSNFLGVIMARDYISVGADTDVAGFNASCGLYSASSYISTGNGASVGSSNCSAPASVTGFLTF